jgi:GT2 family glycosyltransferase
MTTLNGMTLAPIVVFSYNRPNHLRQTLEALAKNDLAHESVLYIYCDGAKPNATGEQCQRIAENRNVAHAVKEFKEVHVVEREHNIGLKDNIVGAVTDIVNQYGRVITLEDDVVTSVGFLKYMNDALELYADEEKVMHVSAYMYPHKSCLPDTFFYPVPYPGGGWATWQRAWRQYNDDAQELFDYWQDKWETFDIYGGDYLSKQLKRNREGTMRTWFVKWYAVMRRQDALTLYPCRSLTNNIGFDEMATNCYTTTKFDVVPTDYVKVERTPLIVNRKAYRIIYDFYQGHWYNKRRRNALIKKAKDAVLFWR